MKGFICAIIILALLFTGAFMYVRTLDKLVNSLEEHIKKIESEAKKEDWQQCKNEIEEATKHWNEIQIKLKAFIEHRDIDEIHRIMSEIKGYAEFTDKENLLVSLEILKTLVHHIPENEKLTLENILDTKPNRIT